MKLFLAASALALFLAPHALYAQSTPASERPIAGLGHAHMDTSCSPGVSPICPPESRWNPLATKCEVMQTSTCEVIPRSYDNKTR